MDPALSTCWLIIPATVKNRNKIKRLQYSDHTGSFVQQAARALTSPVMVCTGCCTLSFAVPLALSTTYESRVFERGMPCMPTLRCRCQDGGRSPSFASLLSNQRNLSHSAYQRRCGARGERLRKRVTGVRRQNAIGAARRFTGE
jgi:hypothetical protein